ncbi:MAG TPA: BolA/IbaG family iron-sulfur metabolism protein [Bdellovibrionales bacterium]|nr:BolA/IbaG family iron-sulfur metabolism protein [Bdellovibrionales bacterium]
MSPTQIEQRLKEFFPNSQIAVEDLTGTENHYEVSVRDLSAFTGLSRIEQHQKVMAAFAAELKTGEVHALSIKTLDK